MKKFYLSIFFVAAGWFAFAQNNSGEIIYDVNLNMEFDLSDPDMPPEAIQFLEQMPKNIKSARKLIFNEKEALFATYDDPDAVQDPNENPMVMMMRRSQENELTYMNMEDDMVTERKEFMGRVFLIKDTLNAYDWKITGEQRQVAGYPCMKATTISKDSAVIAAWFTPSIAAPAGPSGFSKLPGMILGMEMDASAMGGMGGPRRMRRGNNKVIVTIMARTIDLRKVKKNELEEPDKGKVVTREEFREIMQEKFEEMRQQGGGPRFHMRGQ